MDSVVKQFNLGKCTKCESRLVECPYVGGEHDPMAMCVNCGKHYGCWACDKMPLPPERHGTRLNLKP